MVFERRVAEVKVVADWCFVREARPVTQQLAKRNSAGLSTAKAASHFKVRNPISEWLIEPERASVDSAQKTESSEVFGDGLHAE
jgi:hypothetical protein